MKSVGFIGVGAMGSAIASRLVGPYDLLVNDRNPHAAAELVENGATFASLDEIADRCSVVFLCLPGPQQVAELLKGPDGLASRLSPGTVVIDSSTSSPTLDAELDASLAQRGIGFVDSPIGGGVRRARAGTAALMVGAGQETFDRVKDLLLAVTADVFHVGPVGTGHAMKLVNNLLNNCNRFTALEAIRLGQAAGLEQNVIVEVLNKSSGRNYATEVTFPQLLSGETYLPQGFTIDLQLKDLQLATNLAQSLGHPTPIGDLVQAFTQQAIERFGAKADQSQMMAEWYE